MGRVEEAVEEVPFITQTEEVISPVGRNDTTLHATTTLAMLIIVTVALIVSGVGFQIHEGYADANFTSFQIEEIKNISRTEAENDNKILEGKIKKLENNLRDSKEKNKNLEAQLKAIEESLAFTCAGDTCQGRNDYNFIISTALIIGKINPKCSYGSPSFSVDGNGSNCPSGSGAVSFGRKTISSGKGSFTAGFDVVASGSFSTVIGQSLITQPPTPETSQLPTPQITQSPCPDSVVLNDNNAKEKLSDYSGNKEVIRCFDTSKVTNMKILFQDTGINADLSSWDVSSVANMRTMFYGAAKFNGDVSNWDVSSVINMG